MIRPRLSHLYYTKSDRYTPTSVVGNRRAIAAGRRVQLGGGKRPAFGIAGAVVVWRRAASACFSGHSPGPWNRA